jgi:hypothetical protein
VILRYHLRLFPMPKVIMQSLYVYPVSLIEPIASWLSQTVHSLPASVEQLLLMGLAPPTAAAQLRSTGDILSAYWAGVKSRSQCISPYRSVRSISLTGCNRQSEIYNLKLLARGLSSVGRAPQWHQWRDDFLKLVRLALTCSTLGKPAKMRDLN